MGFSFNLFIIISDQLMLFIINMLVARHAGEILFGDFNVATNGLLLLSTLITLGMDSIVAYYVPKFYAKKKYADITHLMQSMKNFLRPIYYTVAVAGLLFGITVLALGEAIRKLMAFDIGHPLFLFLWGTVALSLYNIYVQYFRAVNRMRTAVIMSLLQTLCYFLFSLVIYFYLYPVLFHHNKNYFPHVMLIGFISSYVTMVLLALYLQKRNEFQTRQKKLSKDQHAWKEKIYGYTVQNLNKYIFTAVPLMIIEWCGHNEHSVGLFAAISSIISLAFIAIGPIGILIAPEISASFAESREQLKSVMKKYLLICVGISLVIMAVMGFFARQILLLYQSNFIDALPYTYVCLINVLTYAVSMPLSKMIQYSARGSEIGAKLTLNLLLFQIIASLILIKWLGLVGAVICYVGINIVYNLVMIILAVKIYRNDPFGSESY